MFIASANVFARTELVSRIDFRNDFYRIRAELYFDKNQMRPHLWVNYEQQGSPDEEKSSFTATSLLDRFRDTEWGFKAAPITFIDGKIIQIFAAYNLRTAEYDANKGMALIFHFPLSELDQKSLEFLEKTFPEGLAKDQAGKPAFIKAMLCRVTMTQVFPIAAFNREPIFQRPR